VEEHKINQTYMRGITEIQISKNTEPINPHMMKLKESTESVMSKGKSSSHRDGKRKRKGICSLQFPVIRKTKATLHKT